MANIDTNTCNLFLGKILTQSSVHLTAFVLKRLITFCTSYISLSDVHFAMHFIYLIYMLCGSLPSCILILYTYAAETVYHPDF